jgi:hypothetical protein
MIMIIILSANEQVASSLVSLTCTASFHGSDRFQIQNDLLLNTYNLKL